MNHETEFAFTPEPEKIEQVASTEASEQIATAMNEEVKPEAKAKLRKSEQAKKFVKTNKSVLIAALVGAAVMFAGLQVTDALTHPHQSMSQHYRR